MAVSLAATFTVAGALDAQQISEFRSNVSNTFGRASRGQASWGMMVVALDAGDAHGFRFLKRGGDDQCICAGRGPESFQDLLLIFLKIILLQYMPRILRNC